MAQLFIGQLPFNKFYPEDLLRLFQPYGIVTTHELYIRKGNAFVTYATAAEADAAIQALHGRYTVEGRNQPLQVMYSKGSKLISSYGIHHRSMCLMMKEVRQQKSTSSPAGSTASRTNAAANGSLTTVAPTTATSIMAGGNGLMMTADADGERLEGYPASDFIISSPVPYYDNAELSFITAFNSFNDISGKSDGSWGTTTNITDEDSGTPSVTTFAVPSSLPYPVPVAPYSTSYAAPPANASAPNWTVQTSQPSFLLAAPSSHQPQFMIFPAATGRSPLQQPASTPTPAMYLMLPTSAATPNGAASSQQLFGAPQQLIYGASSPSVAYHSSSNYLYAPANLKGTSL